MPKPRQTSGVNYVVPSSRRGLGYMWVRDLGLALRVRPGMTPSSGADFSAPGISPCPLRGSRPT
eukprot:682771-Prymnesium_polylepis.1